MQGVESVIKIILTLLALYPIPKFNASEPEGVHEHFRGSVLTLPNVLANPWGIYFSPLKGRRFHGIPLCHQFREVVFVERAGLFHGIEMLQVNIVPATFLADIKAWLIFTPVRVHLKPCRPRFRLQRLHFGRKRCYGLFFGVALAKYARHIAISSGLLWLGYLPQPYVLAPIVEPPMFAPDGNSPQ